MKIHSITTPIGGAILAQIVEPIHPIEAPEGWGLVFFGRCNRATFAGIVATSTALWIADYNVKTKEAIIMPPSPLAGKTMVIDTSCVEVIIRCPACGSDRVQSSDPNWKCGDCGKQWRKAPKPRGGARPRKNKNSIDIQ